MEKINYLFEIKFDEEQKLIIAKYWDKKEGVLGIKDFVNHKEMINFCRQNNAFVYSTVEEYCEIFGMSVSAFDDEEIKKGKAMRCPSCGDSKFEVKRVEVSVGELDEDGLLVNLTDRYFDNEYRVDCLECEYSTTVYTDYENLGY